MKKLATLLASWPKWQLYGNADVEIAGIKDDSRQVGQGDLFVAITGSKIDRHRHIPAALAQGATAIVGEKPLAKVEALVGTKMPAPYIQVENSREALAHLAAAWYDHPARDLRVIGVTGTDGKTTTVSLIAAILDAAGYRTGLISSVSAVIDGQEQDTGFHTTTPEALDVQRYLADMIEADADYAILESTSHGLAQHRVTACEYDVAAFTNITHEHLDYHGSFEAYRDAKAELFRHLGRGVDKGIPKTAVLNVDDPSWQYLRAIPADQYITYGLDHPADVSAAEIEFGPSGLAFLAHTPVGTFRLESKLVGYFNVSNILAAISVALSQNVSPKAIQEGVRTMLGIKGRMDPIDRGQDFGVLVDFAHTPNALEKALTAVRALAAGRIIVAFGCAGLRDREKRPAMGEIACRLADYTILTAEDPRTESLAKILDQIASGCQRAGGVAGKDYELVPDRQEAIQRAVDVAAPGDLVVITGKGHEQSMCFGTVEYPWSDHAAAAKALDQRLKRDG